VAQSDQPHDRLRAARRLQRLRRLSVAHPEGGLWSLADGRGYRLANLDEALVEARLGADFYDRRAGRRNLESELGVYRIKRGVAGIGTVRAGLALAARVASLSARGPARLVYERLLRR
jgi:hypothetical protein